MKKIIATLGLIGILLVSSATTKAGILVGDSEGSNNSQTCRETRSHVSKTNTDWAIFITAFTGTVMTVFTGINTFQSFTLGSGRSQTPVNCGSK